MAKLGIGDFDQSGLGAKSDAEPGFLDHHLVIRAIADSQHIGRIEAKPIARFDREFACERPSTIGSPTSPDSLPPAKMRRLALTRSKPTMLRDRLGEGQKAPGYEQAARTACTHGLDQGPSAIGQMHALHETSMQFALVETGEQANPFPQGAGKIQLALHGALGDPRDLVLEARIIGELVDAFLADDGRIHVGDEQIASSAAPLAGRRCRRRRAHRAPSGRRGPYR